MFSVMMMPMSATSPMAMAMPASDMMLLSTPSQYMTMKLIATDSGSVGRIASELRRCSRKITTTSPATIPSSVSASRSVSIVS
jgi:hypothetical protein